MLDPLAVAVEHARDGAAAAATASTTSARAPPAGSACWTPPSCRPTYNAPPDWFCAHIAGGPDALLAAVEDAEDDAEAGAAELAAVPPDRRRGASASPPAAARRTCSARCAAAARAGLPHRADRGRPARRRASAWVDVFIGVDTGPEVIAGSTRMKAATAQKLLLNAFSTAVMVRLGRVYSNFMIDMVPTNAKLRGRMSEHPGRGDRPRRGGLPPHPRRGRRRPAGRPGRAAGRPRGGRGPRRAGRPRQPRPRRRRRPHRLSPTGALIAVAGEDAGPPQIMARNRQIAVPGERSRTPFAGFSWPNGCAFHSMGYAGPAFGWARCGTVQ